MAHNESVLICDQVAPILQDILKKNGLKITYEPEIGRASCRERV